MTKKYLMTLLLLATCLALLMPSLGMAKEYQEDGGMYYPDDGVGGPLTPEEYQAMMGGGHAPYCNGPGHCTCGAESAPDPNYPHTAWKNELDLRARAKAVGGSWVTELWTENAVLNGRYTDLKMFQDGKKVLMKESLEWIPETGTKKFIATLDDEDPLKIEVRVTGKTFSAFDEHKIAQVSIVSREKPGELSFEVASLKARYDSLGYIGNETMAITPGDSLFQERYRDAAMDAYASEMAKYQLYLLNASPEERELYDKNGLIAATGALEKAGYFFTYSDYVKALSDGTRKPTRKSKAELEMLFEQYDQAYDQMIAKEEKLKKDYEAGLLSDRDFVDEYKELVKEQNKVFEELTLIRAELEVFHTKKNG